MSNVVPMRPYAYVEWLDIAIKVNKLRMERGQALCNDAWTLWKRFFQGEAS